MAWVKDGQLALDGRRQERPGTRPDDIGVERMAEPELAPAAILSQHDEAPPFEAEERNGLNELLEEAEAERLTQRNDVESPAFGVFEALDPGADELGNAGRHAQLADERPATIPLLDRARVEPAQAQFPRDEWIAVGAPDDRLLDLGVDRAVKHVRCDLFDGAVIERTDLDSGGEALLPQGNHGIGNGLAAPDRRHHERRHRHRQLEDERGGMVVEEVGVVD